jgi:hypothetical protein
MGLPEALIDLQDGRLGNIPSDLGNKHFAIGISSKGVANTVYVIADKDDVREKLGTGPLAESCAKKVARGVRPVYAIGLGIATQGAAGTVTKVGTGTSPLTVSGNSVDAFEFIVEITRAGANLAANTAAFRYSTDGGDTYSPEIAVPISGAVTNAVADTGLTLTFGAGTFVVGDKYTFSASAPVGDTTTLAAALDAALAANTFDVEGVHVVAALNATAAAVLITKINTARAAYKFWYGAGETRIRNSGESTDAWETALLTDYANTTHQWTVIGAGEAEVLSKLTAKIERRNPMTEMLTHALGGAVSQSPGEVLRGEVPGVVKLHHDEFGRDRLSTKFMTMRTFDGYPGFYNTDGRTLAAPTSDYQFFEAVRVINKVARAARNVAIKYVNARFRVDAAGLLDGRDLGALVADFNTPLDAIVAAGDLSSYTVVIDPSQNILATKLIEVSVDCVPVGITRIVQVKLGYINPRLIAPAAALAPAA